VTPPGPRPLDGAWGRSAGDVAWLLLTAGLLAFVARCGVNFPFMDEWPMVSALTNAEPVRPWLFGWHNEHLLPLPRLVFWAAFQLGHDYRLAMVLSVALWSALARLLMASARAARGGPAQSDALFPLLLLHPGQWENVLMSYQVGFALSAFLAGLSFTLIGSGRPTAWRVAAVAICVALLPGCGGHGLLFASAGVGWLLVLLARRASEGSSRNDSAATLALVGLLAFAAAASLYAWYPGKPPPPADVPPLTGGRFVVGLLGFAAAGYGPAGVAAIPVSFVAVSLVGIGFVVTTWRTRRELLGPRGPAWAGSVAAVLAVTLLAAAIAYGRGRYNLASATFPRYVGLSALLPASVALLCLRFTPGEFGARLPEAIAVLSLIALPFNAWSGWGSGERLAEVQRSARAELAAGVPVEFVVRKYDFLIYNDPAAVTRFIAGYAASGVGAFDRVTHEQPFAAVPLPPPTAGDNVRPLENGGWASTGREGSLTFDLPAPRFASAVVIRGRYRYPAPWPPARATVGIRATPGGPEVTQTALAYRLPRGRDDSAILVWVNGPVASMRVSPDAHPWGFAVTSAELLVPAE
jgi:hypothetical protein